jgi:hypothetical protein
MTNETVVHAVYETMCCQFIYIYIKSIMSIGFGF